MWSKPVVERVHLTASAPASPKKDSVDRTIVSGSSVDQKRLQTTLLTAHKSGSPKKELARRTKDSGSTVEKKTVTNYVIRGPANAYLSPIIRRPADAEASSTNRTKNCLKYARCYDVHGQLQFTIMCPEKMRVMRRYPRRLLNWMAGVMPHCVRTKVPTKVQEQNRTY